MALQILIEFLIVALAGIMGVFSFKGMNLFFRLLYVQLLAWITIYVLSIVVTENQKMQGLPPDNQWLFNVNMFVESFFLFFAAFIWQDAKPFKKLIAIIYFIFLFTFLFLVSKKGFFIFNDYACAFESLVVIFVYGLILRQNFYDKTDSIYKKPERWVCVGLILYFSCVVPYASFFQLINHQTPKLGKALAHIPELLTNVRYLLLGIGFWLIWQNKLKPAPPPSHV
jgi:hypothetical protein